MSQSALAAQHCDPLLTLVLKWIVCIRTYTYNIAYRAGASLSTNHGTKEPLLAIRGECSTYEHPSRTKDEGKFSNHRCDSDPLLSPLHLCFAQEVVLDLDCAGPTDYRNTLVVGSRKKFGNGRTPIAETTEDERFRTHRFTLPGYDEFTYTLPGLPNGAVTLVLEFAEYVYANCKGGVGSRVFSVAVDGAVVLSDFDVYVADGNRCRVAVVEELPVNISDEKLRVKFIRGAAGDPMISGIKVRIEDTSSATTVPPTMATTSTTTPDLNSATTVPPTTATLSTTTLDLPSVTTVPLTTATTSTTTLDLTSSSTVTRTTT